MGKYELLATTSLMFNVVAFASLVINIYTTKDASSFNWGYLLGNILAQVLLILYGIANKSYGIYGPTALLIIGLSYIVYIKLAYSQPTGPYPSGPHSTDTHSTDTHSTDTQPHDDTYSANAQAYGMH